MKVEDYFSYREDQLNSGIFLTLNGVLVHSVMVKLTDMLKSNVSLFIIDRNIEMKIFATVIEQAQNILFYSAERIQVPMLGSELMGVGSLSIGFKDEHYFAICGNLIPNDKVEKLRGKLQIVQNMNAEELKQYFKEQRRLEPDADSKGAGLGFIEIARKACRPIEFCFTPVDEQNSFFTFKATI